MPLPGHLIVMVWMAGLASGSRDADAVDLLRVLQDRTERIATTWNTTESGVSAAHARVEFLKFIEQRQQIDIGSLENEQGAAIFDLYQQSLRKVLQDLHQSVPRNDDLPDEHALVTRGMELAKHLQVVPPAWLTTSHVFLTLEGRKPGDLSSGELRTLFGELVALTGSAEAGPELVRQWRRSVGHLALVWPESPSAELPSLIEVLETLHRTLHSRNEALPDTAVKRALREVHRRVEKLPTTPTREDLTRWIQILGEVHTLGTLVQGSPPQARQAWESVVDALPGMPLGLRFAPSDRIRDIEEVLSQTQASQDSRPRSRPIGWRFAANDPWFESEPSLLTAMNALPPELRRVSAGVRSLELLDRHGNVVTQLVAKVLFRDSSAWEVELPEEIPAGFELVVLETGDRLMLEREPWRTDRLFWCLSRLLADEETKRSPLPVYQFVKRLWERSSAGASVAFPRTDSPHPDEEEALSLLVRLRASLDNETHQAAADPFLIRDAEMAAELGRHLLEVPQFTPDPLRLPRREQMEDGLQDALRRLPLPASLRQAGLMLDRGETFASQNDDESSYQILSVVPLGRTR